jgi:uncharacterized Ntn-hydrolase superfamily protein
MSDPSGNRTARGAMRFRLGSEQHTFAMIGRCADSGLLGVCVTSNPPSVASRCPHVRANVGAVSTQSYTDPGLGLFALKLLELGYAPERAIDELRASDEWAEYRQIGIVDRDGRSAAYTGSHSLEWRGHLLGPGYVALGNNLTNDGVLDKMVKAFRDASGEILEERLLRAIEAGRNAGGEKAGHLSAGLITYGRDTYPRTDLRVDVYPSLPEHSGDAVDELRRVFAVYKPLIPYYELRPRNPKLASWRDWSNRSGA